MQNYYAVLGLVLLAISAYYIFRGYQQYRRRLRMKLEPVPVGPDVEVRSLDAVSKVRVVERTADSFVPPADSRIVPSLRGIVVRGREPELPEPELQADLPIEEPVEAVLPVVVAEAPVEMLEAVAELADEPEQEEEVVAVAAAVEEVPVLAQPAVHIEPLIDDDSAYEPAYEDEDGDDETVVVEMPVIRARAAGRARGLSVVQVAQQDMFAGEAVAPPRSPNRRRAVAARTSTLYEVQALEPVNLLGKGNSQPSLPTEDVQDVIAVHVICRGKPFPGEDLLRCILSCGLRFGDMGIFHRHETATGQGQVLFSMAKAVEPGTFDLVGMTSEDVPGVSFFLALPGVNSIQAYDIMIDTAKRLAFELGGEILDLQQSPLTRQLVEHYRERVAEFERQRMMLRRVR